MSEDKFHHILMFTVAIGVLSSFLFIVVSLVTIEIPETNEKAAIHLIGAIEGAVLYLVGYYFGTSKSSRDKNKAFFERDKNQEK